MSSEKILSTHGVYSGLCHPLLNAAQCLALGTITALDTGRETLTERAGLALAQLALAVAPHARRIWVAAGTGGTAAIGLDAALHLLQWGKGVHVSTPLETTLLPVGMAHAVQRLSSAGATLSHHPPEDWDACIDAMLGIGLHDAPQNTYSDWIDIINTKKGCVIAADVPSGLMADTGATPGACVRATHTLTLLGLKPGLFTHHGRDVCGTVWFNALGTHAPMPPVAWLNPAPSVQPRRHASNKGNYGDVMVIAGMATMQGASILAARAALHGGAGRVYLGVPPQRLLHADGDLPADLMQRNVDTADVHGMTLVVGCGGGKEVSHMLPHWLSASTQLVLDADALNAIAACDALKDLVKQRVAHTTIMTPHPLEAARLLGCKVQDVQSDRLHAAQQLANRYHCTVVLEGSGTVVAAPSRTPHLNVTGNAKLAIAGAGDVLSGMMAAAWAHHADAWRAACEACYQHGALADGWPRAHALTASRLIEHM
ncbi:MAG: NAD(P)H-hydrate dehydratase [Rhodoferax sp.]|nr:NAD(P)H-hydrate dehydratase [Rhodoferax sp.]